VTWLGNENAQNYNALEFLIKKIHQHIAVTAHINTDSTVKTKLPFANSSELFAIFFPTRFVTLKLVLNISSSGHHHSIIILPPFVPEGFLIILVSQPTDSGCESSGSELKIMNKRTFTAAKCRTCCKVAQKTNSASTIDRI
jgi:hypothetical protein